MDEFEIECNYCFWQGYVSDLESKTDDLEDKKFIYCPDCGGSDISDIETEEIEALMNSNC